LGQRVSTGQAGCNSLAAWLASQLDPAIKVIAKWGYKRLNPHPVVTIVPVGKRRREDVHAPFDTVTTNLTSATAALPTQQVKFRVGGYMQNIQLDVWASEYDTRDEVIDMLDDALTAGTAQTLAQYFAAQALLGNFLTGDVIRDGVLLQLREEDGYEGFVDILLDEPDTHDDPDAVARGEFRATYFGEMRGDYIRTRITPRITKLVLKEQVYVSATPPSPTVVPYQVTTFTQNPTPPPVIKVTHGTSTT
jgi:hypothetical protein